MGSATREVEKSGRVVATRLTHGEFCAVLICIYAFPESHPMHELNEELFAHVFAWAIALKVPVLWGGDFNESVQSSAFVCPANYAGV